MSCKHALSQPKQLLFLIIVSPFYLFSQNLPDKEPWQIGCDKSDNNAEIIACSYLSLKIADSILISIHNDIIHRYQLLIEENKPAMIVAEKTKSESNGFDIAENILQKYQQSMKLFFEYRESMMKYQAIRYNGGRLKSYYENKLGLLITIKQIEILRKLRE